MDVKKAFIEDILNPRTRLRVPFFQRHYRWKEDNWKRFFDDMISLVEMNHDYFLGSIILKEESEENQITQREIDEEGVRAKYLIIDGQQRLTTLCIFLKLLYFRASKRVDFNNEFLCGPNKNRSTISHNSVDRLDFQRIMELEAPTPFTGTSRIFEAYNYFNKRFGDAETINTIGSFERLINNLSKVRLVQITLGREEDEQQIFDTLNSIGEPLTTDELLKNLLYYNSTFEEAYTNNWKPVFDTEEAKEFWGTDAAAEKVKKSDKMMDRFLFAFVRIKIGDLGITGNNKKEFVKKDNVYTACKSFVSSNGYRIDHQTLANEIIDYAKIFKENFDDDYIFEEKLTHQSGIKRIVFLIRALQSYDTLPYVLYILKNANQEEQIKIFDYLEKYIIRRRIAGSPNNSVAEMFAESLISSEHADTYDKFRSYIENRDTSAQVAMPRTIDMLSGIIGGKDANKASKVIYYMYETKNEDCALEGFNAYDTYQLMPKPSAKVSTNDWPLSQGDNEAERIQLIKTIGNYFLLANNKKSILNNISNNGLGNKKNCWTNFIANITSDEIIGNLTSWTADSIAKRNNELARKWATETWSID